MFHVVSLVLGCALGLYAGPPFLIEKTDQAFQGLDYVLLVQEGDEITQLGRLDPEEPLAPCSTFKLPHAALALNHGAISEGNDLRTCNPLECHSAHGRIDLATSLKVSCISYYRQIARQIGVVKERESLQRMGYPGRGTFEPGDGFWLTSPGMQITARQQLAWIRRFYSEDLGIKARDLERVRNASLRASTSRWTLWGKTGSAGPKADRPHGWFVGRIRWVDGRTMFVAILVKGRGFDFLGSEGETRLKRLLGSDR